MLNCMDRLSVSPRNGLPVTRRVLNIQHTQKSPFDPHPTSLTHFDNVDRKRSISPIIPDW